MTAPFRLAHLSDAHLPPVPPLPWHLANAKRLLGLVNWRRRRQHQHDAGLLARLVADLATEAPEHIAVTGDLCNLGLPAEFEAATRWLASLGPPTTVSVVPGNHDIYVPMAPPDGIGRWRDYMQGTATTGAFPYVRRLRHVALIGLNSAYPTPLFNAGGRLGTTQLERLALLLDRLAAEGLVRVVLIHHPPLPGQASPRKALADAADLARVLARHGAELVLHGHNHRAMLAFAEGPLRPIPVIGAASASIARATGHQTLARYNVFTIGTDPGQPIAIVERGLATPDGPIVEIGRRLLAEYQPAATAPRA